MNRNINYKGISFYIANYTPRRNQYEKGLKYQLFIKSPDYIAPHPEYIPTNIYFCTIHEGKRWIKANYYIFK